MVALALTCLVCLQQPTVTVRLDRDRVTVGSEVVLTITVNAAGTEPLEITEPGLDGFEVLDRRERSQVRTQDGQPAKVTVRELQLRALRAGTLTIGRIVVQQGAVVAETEPLLVTVAASAGSVGALSPVVRALLLRASPPSAADEVALAVLPAADTAAVGAQLDLVTIAWFPREIRTQLRNPPVLDGPNVRGAWIHPQPSPAGVALSRQVGGRWYDLFVVHQAVFPLASGALDVGPAMLSYSVPVSGSFLSREIRREHRTEPRSLPVLGLPAGKSGEPFAGALGRAFTLQVEVSTRELRIGDAARVRAEVRGIGNVAFWPEPTLPWPAGLKAYQQDVSVLVEADSGLLRGAKAYQYLVVAESAGTHRVAPSPYEYFDTGTRQLASVSVPALEIVTPGESLAVTPLHAVPQLDIGVGWYRPDAAAARVPRWVWLVLVLLPPLAAVLTRSARRRKARTGSHLTRRVRRTRLEQLEWEFRTVIARLVPGADGQAESALADALRAAGVEGSLAGHAARTRERLRQGLYGRGGPSDPEELSAEVQEVLQALMGHPVRSGPGRATLVPVLVMLCGLAATAAGQTPEELYRAGAVRAAADSFVQRAKAHPRIATHWQDLGSAWDRLGEVARARGAWIRAARLAPRSRTIRQGLASQPVLEEDTEDLLWIAPVTPAEAGMVALLLWWIGWLAFTLGARRRVVTLLVTVAIAVAAFGIGVEWRYRRPVVLVLESGTPLRSAPYGSAETVVALEAGAPLLVRQAWGLWRLTSRGEAVGWVLSSEVIGL